ncbi:MAG: zinc ribbon domain-containing protein [Myxococcota bacterium]
MPHTTPCPHCQQPNDTGARFCASCGASLAPEVHCPSCNSLNPLGNRFCIQCGTTLANAGWAGDGAPAGAVIDGVWERSPNEFVRRVDPEDARRFLGNRSVRVPPGTVGVVVVDGVVDRVLPPGERTTLNLFERVTDFFLRRPGRTAFYLIDQRPIPVPFVVQTRPLGTAAGGQTLKTQVLVSFTLPRGDKAAMGAFLSNVMGDKPAFGAADLHALVRPEVIRASQEALERLALETAADGQLSYADAEARVRAALTTSIGPRFGLAVDVSVAPLTRLASLSFHLGTGVAPRVRKCAACGHELPVSLKFCDACGARQATVTEPARAGQTPDETTALFTSDGQQVELDLVVRVQGQHEDFAASRLAPALVGAAAAYLRETAWAQLQTAAGFAALEAAMRPAAGDALESFGLQIVSLTVVDLRTKTGQWLLSARADLDRAKADVELGREWLAQRDGEMDLEQLTMTQALRRQAIARDAKLGEARAQLSDREAREELAERQARLERAGIARGATTERQKTEVRHTNELGESDHQTELQRKQLEREAERARLAQALKDQEEARQIEKLRAMAAIDREAAAAEHAEVMEKRRQLEALDADRMLALQAAELAQAPGGAAWAEALAARAGAESEKRHAERLAATYDKAMDAMAKVASSRAEAAPVVGRRRHLGRGRQRRVGRGAGHDDLQGVRRAHARRGEVLRRVRRRRLTFVK